MIRVISGELWSFWCFTKIPEDPSQVTKGQEAHISLKWCLIQKNKGTLFTSTLKVGAIKVHLFSWSKLILVSYIHFLFSWRYCKTPHNSKNDKKLISPSNDVWLKKIKALYFLQLQKLKKVILFILFYSVHSHHWGLN